MTKLALLILIGMFSAVAALPVLAGLFDNRNSPGSGWTPGKPPVGTPGPVAGAGPGFLAAGGIYLVHRYRKRKPDARSDQRDRNSQKRR